MLLATRKFVPVVAPVSSVRREMDHLFSRLFDHATENGAARGWFAPVAMWDDADRVYLEVELPGVSKDAIDVTVHNGMLRISGERKAPEADRNYWVNDRSYGTFDRAISLPEEVDADSIDAQFAEGVLQIVILKTPEAQPKKIAVRG